MSDYIKTECQEKLKTFLFLFLISICPILKLTCWSQYWHPEENGSSSISKQSIYMLIYMVCVTSRTRLVGKFFNIPKKLWQPGLPIVQIVCNNVKYAEMECKGINCVWHSVFPCNSNVG